MKKVMIVSVPAWNKKSGSDTFSSLMEGYGADNVANIYIRESLPDSPVCNNYFRISENAVLKSVFKRTLKTGKRVFAEQEHNDNEKNERITEERYKKFSSKKNFFLSMARELVWKFGVWKTKELKAFIDEFKPDVVFFAMEGYIHLNRISRYVIKRSGAKGVGYFWDDNFTYKQSNKLGYKIYRFFQKKSIKKTAKKCSEFFAITPKTKKEADETFGISCKVLTKPIKNTAEYKTYIPNTPIKIMYTGKLIIGRFETVRLIGDVLNIINKNGIKAELDVYTTTYLTEEQLNSVGEYVHILGAIPQTEVAEKQAQADILLFAEALPGPKSKAARLSFSTKITDYMRSGKCILAVGDFDTAPMEYLKQEDAALTAQSEEEIKLALEALINEPNLINEYAKKGYDCGVRNHSEEKIKKLLFKTLNS